MKLLPTLRHRLPETTTGVTQWPLAMSEKIDENLTPNLRALRLALTVGDQLLSMGTPANSVVSKALDITETYCKRPVHVDIVSNLIMLSQLRGMDKEPLTLIRPVVLRDTNNMTVQLVQQLVYRIRQGQLSLDQAEAELEKILKAPITYPRWLIAASNASIAAAVTLMFSTNWRVLVVTFIMGLLVNQLLILMAQRAIPSFYRQAGAAMFITLTAAVIAELARRGLSFFDGMNPTLIVVGGIVMLVAGLVVVGALQDAIEEYYITANARLLKVCMLTVGIVLGILIGLYSARKLGIGIAVSPDPLHLTPLPFQVAGGALAAAAYALATQSRMRAIAWAGTIGGGALAITYFASALAISVIPASGVAAIMVGLVATLFSRLWRTPSAGIVSAGIVPLVPGLSLYNGLMQLVNYPPGNPLFYRGLGTLFTAAATALAIAAGASFGSIIGRPLHQKLTHTRNFLPFVDLMRRQLLADERKSKLAYLALRRAAAQIEHIDKTD